MRPTSRWVAECRYLFGILTFIAACASIVGIAMLLHLPSALAVPFIMVGLIAATYAGRQLAKRDERLGHTARVVPIIGSIILVSASVLGIVNTLNGVLSASYPGREWWWRAVLFVGWASSTCVLALAMVRRLRIRARI